MFLMLLCVGCVIPGCWLFYWSGVWFKDQLGLFHGLSQQYLFGDSGLMMIS